MQNLANSHKLIVSNLALLGLVLLATLIGRNEAAKLDLHEHTSVEEHDHDDDFYLQSNPTKCPMHEQEPEPQPEPFESSHMMNDLLQDEKGPSKMIRSNNIKMINRWQTISNHMNKLDEIWPDILKHIEDRFKTEEIGRHQGKDFPAHGNSNHNKGTFPMNYGILRSSGIEDNQIDFPIQNQHLKKHDSWLKTGSFFPSKLNEFDKQSDQVKIGANLPISAIKNAISHRREQTIKHESENQQPVKQAHISKDAFGYPTVKSGKVQDTMVYSPETTTVISIC